MGVLTVSDVVIVIGALATAIVSIINAVQIRRVAAEQINSADQGLARDNRIKDIHTLVNSGRTVLLRVLVDSLKDKADRSRAPADIAKFQDFRRQLEDAEAATEVVEEHRKAEDAAVVARS